MRLRITLLLSISLVSVRAAAETMRLTLADAIAMAMRNGTQAQLARSAEERARINQMEAFQNLLPQADGRLTRYSQSINLQTFGFSIPGQPPVVGPFNVTDASLSAAMQLFNLAAIRRWQSVRAGLSASHWETTEAENDVAQAVARLYVLVQRASAQVASREADVALFTRLAEVANDEFKAGTGTRLDVAQANVQLTRTRQALLVAQNERHNAIFALLNVIGADEATDVVIADPIPAYAPPPRADVALAAARESRPELKAMTEREREAQLAVTAAKSRRLPSLTANFEGDYSGNYSTDLRWTRRVAGNVAMPLYRADINVFVARARAQLHDVELQRVQRERDVEQDVRPLSSQPADRGSTCAGRDGKRKSGRRSAHRGARAPRCRIWIAGRSRSRAGQLSAGPRRSDLRAGRCGRSASELGAKGDISKMQVDAARANDSAQADLALARARLSESPNAAQAAAANVQQAQGRLVQSEPVSAQVSAAEAQSKLAHAKIQTRQAALEAAQLTLSYTKIVAPAGGIASKLSVHPGSLVGVGQAIVNVVPQHTYVIANFKETQVRNMRPGQQVKVKIDAIGRQQFDGKVESLSAGTGASFSLLPPDNASGNFVKVVQRVPVRVSWNGPSADRVPVGSSADVTVYTK